MWIETIPCGPTTYAFAFRVGTKGIEPLAARVHQQRVSARHQSLHHLVALAPCEDRAVLRIAPRE